MVVDVPHFGETILLIIVCRTCSFKTTDILSTAMHTPKAIIFRIQKLSQLTTRVIKSSTARVQIPELAYENTPGPRSPGYIGSVESVLEEISVALELLSSQVQNDPRKRTRLLDLEQKLKAAKAGKYPFTLIIEDPSGNSAILPDPPDQVIVSRLRIKKGSTPSSTQLLS